MRLSATLWRTIAYISLCCAAFLVGALDHAPVGVTGGRVAALMLVILGVVAASRGFGVRRRSPMDAVNVDSCTLRKVVLSIIAAMAGICMATASWLVSHERSVAASTVLILVIFCGAIVFEVCARRVLGAHETS